MSRRWRHRRPAGVVVHRTGASAHAIEAGKETGQRCTQVVGNVVADTLHLAHQTLDLVEHLVHDADQPAYIPAGAGLRQPARQVAGDDASCCERNGSDLTHSAHPDDHGPHQAEKRREAPRHQHRVEQNLVEFAQVADALRHQKGVPRRQLPHQTPKGSSAEPTVGPEIERLRSAFMLRRKRDHRAGHPQLVGAEQRDRTLVVQFQPPWRLSSWRISVSTLRRARPPPSRRIRFVHPVREKVPHLPIDEGEQTNEVRLNSARKIRARRKLVVR